MIDPDGEMAETIAAAAFILSPDPITKAVFVTAIVIVAVNAYNCLTENSSKEVGSYTNTIITDCDVGIDITQEASIAVSYTNVFGNNLEYSGPDFEPGAGVFSADPLFASRGNQHYYLKSISAGQEVDSPCIDAGPESFILENTIGGTTRTDGIFNQCQQDIGYHYRKFSHVAGVGNINNDAYEIDDPKSLLNTADNKIDTKSFTIPDPSSILSTGPKDLVIITENPDGTRDFRTYFNQDCFLEFQTDQESPLGVIDAALCDLTYKPESHAIEVVDFNSDGVMDVLIASDQGTHIQMADDHLMYSDFQLLDSGNTTNMVLFDFNRDGDTDLVTINTSGIVTFYENRRNDGFIEVGTPGRALNAGELKIMDYNNDGEMDVVVEIAPGVDQIVEVGGAFGIQGYLPSGKRSIQYGMFDHLGTTKILVDDEGDITWPRPGNETNELLPFGKDMDFDPLNPDPNEAAYKLTFTNKEIDHQLDLHYFGARYYHANLPRFISPDPVGGTPEIPISWNRYLYCRNDPINLVDLTGLVWEYAQNTGVLTHINDETGARQEVATGYSGHGEGLNNSDMEDVRDVGPIPRGSYTIGAARNDLGGLGPTVMNLDANEGTDTHGRDLFRVHGDNGNNDQSASEGCIVLGPAARQEISNSGDNQIVIVSGQAQNNDVPDDPPPPEPNHENGQAGP
ncbi:DUF2778 domain-containing protein [bacterium]|nr:DUF2778 domain-containing protein [bacterium]